MYTKAMTIKKATEEWVRGFNAISSSLLERAFKNNINSWRELTPITKNDYVYYDDIYVTVAEVKFKKNCYGIDFGNSKIVIDLEEERSISLSDKEIDSIYVNGEKIEINEYDFENNVFLLKNDTKINFTDVSKVTYLTLDADVLSIDKDEDNNDFDFEIKLDQIIVDYYDVDSEYDSWLPMWGTLWTFEEDLDKDWARKNPEIVAKCGFRIFEDKETKEIYIGIDGDDDDYDFYEAHWIRLYKARGLQWHIVS